MMGKTHLTMGMASALVMTNPQTIQECFVAIAGGAIGGIICDIDILDNDYEKDVWNVQLIATGITAIGLIADFLLKNGICEYILENRESSLRGGILFAVLWIIGVKSKHRSFTHSFLALVLFSAVLGLIYPPIVNSFAIGFLSHLILDLLNKKKIRLFYPMDFGLCFGLCYADGIANKFFMRVGWFVCVISVLRTVILLICTII